MSSLYPVFSFFSLTLKLCLSIVVFEFSVVYLHCIEAKIIKLKLLADVQRFKNEISLCCWKKGQCGSFSPFKYHKIACAQFNKRLNHYKNKCGHWFGVVSSGVNALRLNTSRQITSQHTHEYTYFTYTT